MYLFFQEQKSHLLVVLKKKKKGFFFHLLSHLLFFNVLSALVHPEKHYSNWRYNEIMTPQEKRDWNLSKWENKGFLATVHNSFHSFWVISTDQLCLLNTIWENRFYFFVANTDNRCFFHIWFLVFWIKNQNTSPVL